MKKVKVYMLNSYIEPFLEVLKLRNYASATIKSYRDHLTLFLRWCRESSVTDIRLITTDYIREYQKDIMNHGLTPETVHLKLRSLKRFFEYMEETNQLLCNPADRIIFPNLGTRLPKHILTIAEMKRLLETPNTGMWYGIRDRAILEVLYSTGIRRAECVNLNVYDIDYDAGCLRVNNGKGAKDRIVPVGASALTWTKEYAQKIRPRHADKQPNTRTLFLTNQGRAFTGTALGRLVGRYAKRSRLNKPVSAHTIRRSLATHMLQEGAHPQYVQRILGHATIDTIEKYVRLTGADLKKTHKNTHPREIAKV